MTGNLGYAQLREEPPRLIIKYCPAALASFTAPGIQFGLEYRFHPNRAWHNELGYVYNVGADTRNIKKLNGLRILSEYRYYFRKSGVSLFNNVYIGINARYILLDSDRSGTFRIDNGAYSQRIDFKLTEQRFALDASFGFEKLLFERITFGLGLVIGRGWKFQKSSGIPEGANYVRPDFSPLRLLEAGDFNSYADVLLRFQVGYILK
jgi:hypothetical protein